MVANNAAGPEPGRYLLLNIGIGGLWMLLLTLCLTPLTKLTRWKGFALIRRQLGLWALTYATLHLLSYALFILGLNWSRLGSEIIKRPYIIVGMIALIGLAVLGATSNRWAMKRLGKRWKPLHKMLLRHFWGLVLLHFFLGWYAPTCRSGPCMPPSQRSSWQRACRRWLARCLSSAPARTAKTDKDTARWGRTCSRCVQLTRCRLGEIQG